MVLAAEFYLIPEDVFRLGNATESRLGNVRGPRDVQTMDVNGVTVVVANRKGVSVFGRAGIARAPLSWVWRIAANTPMPPGLQLVHAPLPGIPDTTSSPRSTTWPLATYKGLLEDLALHATKIGKHEVKQA